jgi:hypothetical protein
MDDSEGTNRANAYDNKQQQQSGAGKVRAVEPLVGSAYDEFRQMGSSRMQGRFESFEPGEGRALARFAKL